MKSVVAFLFVISIAFPLSALAGLSDGLVLHYTFDQGIVNDESGNGNNGIIENARFVEGYRGKAIKFDGYQNPGRLHVPNSQTLQFNNVLTISYFIKLDGFVGGTGYYNQYAAGGAQAILAKSHDRSGFISMLALQDATAKAAQWSSINRYGDGVLFDYGVTNTPMTYSRWAHVALVFNNGLSYYYNGVLFGHQDGTIDLGVANTQDLYFGKFSDYWYPFNGCLDEIRIYNRALSSSEVAQLYKLDASGANDNSNVVDSAAEIDPTDRHTFSFEEQSGLATNTSYALVVNAYAENGLPDTTFGDASEKTIYISSTCEYKGMSKAKFAHGKATAGVAFENPAKNCKFNGVVGNHRFTSNVFSVTGSGELHDGIISGKINGYTGGQKTYICSSMADNSSNCTEIQLSTEGQFNFFQYPGVYYIRIFDDNWLDTSTQVHVSPDALTMATLSPTEKQSVQGKRYVFLVPGIMGSTLKGTSERNHYPLLSAKHADTSDLMLFDPIAIINPVIKWQGLINQLSQAGYIVKLYPYDWRDHPVYTAQDLYARLKELTPHALSIDVVAHSMGGLVTRELIQSDYYDETLIDKFAMLGTPNHGAVQVYPIVEGGDPVATDEMDSTSDWIDLNATTLDNLYKEIYSSSMLAGREKYRIDKSYIRKFVDDYIHSTYSLIPSYSNPLMDNSGGNRLNIGSAKYKNLFLDRLNECAGFTGMNENLSRIKEGGIVKTKIFCSIEKDTPFTINIKPSTHTDIDMNSDGEYMNIYEKYKGDGTVPANESALIPGVASFVRNDAGSHTDLVSKFSSDVVAFLNEGREDMKKASPQPASGNTRKGEDATGLSVGVKIIGNSGGYLTSPDGRKLGYDDAQGVFYDTIETGNYFRSNEMITLSFDDCSPGVYHLTLSGKKSALVYFEISAQFGEKESTAKAFVDYTGATTTYTFTINTSPELNMAVANKTNTRLTASKNQDGSTLLRWSSNPNIASASIWKKPLDTNYFTKLADLGNAVNSLNVSDSFSGDGVVYVLTGKTGTGEDVVMDASASNLYLNTNVPVPYNLLLQN